MVEPCKGSDEHIIIELDARSARSRVNRILQYLCNQPAEAKQSRFNYFRFDAIFGETSTYASPSPTSESTSNHIDFLPKDQLQLHPQRQQLLFRTERQFPRPRPAPLRQVGPDSTVRRQRILPPSPTLMGSPLQSQQK